MAQSITCLLFHKVPVKVTFYVLEPHQPFCPWHKLLLFLGLHGSFPQIPAWSVSFYYSLCKYLFLRVIMLSTVPENSPDSIITLVPFFFISFLALMTICNDFNSSSYLFIFFFLFSVLFNCNIRSIRIGSL